MWFILVSSQVTVVHIYETSATTNVYNSESAYSSAMSKESSLDVSVSGEFSTVGVSGSASVRNPTPSTLNPKP